MPIHGIDFPSLIAVRAAVAAVWMYEGLWCKVLGREARQESVVAAVPKFGAQFGHAFLNALGVVEILMACWIVSGFHPAACALTQIVLLVLLNANGLLWARHIIHDPAGMVVKNIAFLMLVWVCGAMPGTHL